MSNLTTSINVQIDKGAQEKENFELYQYFTEDELGKAAKELVYIKKYPEEYKSFDNVEDLKKALLSDD